jgi:protein-tyrosine phosphatase
MDEQNLVHLRQMLPLGATAQMSLLMAYSRGFAGVRDVPDPYYGAPAGFDRVLDLVEDACEGLVERLKAANVEGTS